MKVLKPLLLVLAVLAVIVAIGAYVLLGNLDNIVRRAVERTGSDLTGTPVTLDGVAIDLRAGRATLSGLVVANPPGYDSAYAFSLGAVNVDLDSASIARDVIVLEDVTVDGARLVAEQKGTGSNLSDILRHVREHATPAAEPGGEPSELRLAVNRFAFTDTAATLRVSGYGEETLRVPDVVRSAMGSPEQGLPPAELAQRLLRAVLEEAQRAVTAAVSDQAKDAAAEAAKQKLKDKLDLSDEAMDSAEGALRSLFKGD